MTGQRDQAKTAARPAEVHRRIVELGAAGRREEALTLIDPDVIDHRYTLRGTHAASGRSYEVTGLDMIRVQDGRLAGHWALLDSAAMQHQLGADAGA